MSEVDDGDATVLVVRRTIRAPATRLFDAWTRPEHLRRWWGPRPVTCASAEVDLRVGGAHRIGNLLPDGKLLWIVGEFERVAPPHELVYTWRLEPGGAAAERVTVRFEPRDGVTDVVVIHERIATAAARDGHRAGWDGCLDGLERFAAEA